MTWQRSLIWWMTSQVSIFFKFCSNICYYGSHGALIWSVTEHTCCQASTDATDEGRGKYVAPI